MRKSRFDLLCAASVVCIPLPPEPISVIVTQDVLSPDGIVVTSSKIVSEDPSETLSVFKISDFSISNLIAAGVDEDVLRPVSISPSTLAAADMIGRAEQLDVLPLTTDSNGTSQVEFGSES